VPALLLVSSMCLFVALLLPTPGVSTLVLTTLTIAFSLGWALHHTAHKPPQEV
jgi:hypothetical protein